jgi:hypothetical protein
MRVQIFPITDIYAMLGDYQSWGCTGFDRDFEGLSACLGWSAGPVKSRPNVFGNEAEFAMAA